MIALVKFIGIFIICMGAWVLLTPKATGDRPFGCFGCCGWNSYLDPRDGESQGHPELVGEKA